MKIPKCLIINFLTKLYLKGADSFPLTILSSRMQSMISDLWFSMIVSLPFFLLFLIPFLTIQSLILDNDDFLTSYLLTMIVPWLIMMFILLNKDIANGMSAGKRTFGYRIVDYKTKGDVSKIQCMMRNVTMMIWPLEVIMILISPNRRIGDLIAKTEVVKSETKPIETLLEDLNSINKISSNLIIYSVIISVIMTFIMSWGTI